jgi:hypothetical protein
MGMGADRPVSPETARGVGRVEMACGPRADIVVDWIMEIPVFVASG